ncbi:MAG: HEAT repeat domain-containing protein [Cyanobacteria bacterium P01_D01_bin.50]
MSKKKLYWEPLTKFCLGLEASVLCIGLTLAPCHGVLTQEVDNSGDIKQYLGILSNSSQRKRANFRLKQIIDSEDVEQVFVHLKDKNPRIRGGTAAALGKFPEKAALVVPKLIRVLQDENSQVRANAAYGLARIGSKAQLALPALIEALSFEELNTAISTLEGALKIIQDSQDNFEKRQKARISRSLFAIKTEKDSRILAIALEWVGKNPWLATIIIYLIFFPSLWMSLLWIRPLWLLKTNNILQPLSNLQLPEALGGWTISIPGLIFLRPFIYRSRVLDTWVETYIKVAQESFSQKKTVSTCLDRIPIPVILDGKTVTNLSAEDLQASFDKKLTNILIWAEGGAGKTSLACQIAKMGMSDDRKQRLCKHKMLPILIEQELDFDVVEGEQPFIETVAGQLQILIGESEAIPNRFNLIGFMNKLKSQLYKL